MPEKRQFYQNLSGIHFFHQIIFALLVSSRQAANQLKAFPIPNYISFLIFFYKIKYNLSERLGGFIEFSKELDYFSNDEICFKELT